MSCSFQREMRRRVAKDVKKEDQEYVTVSDSRKVVVVVIVWEAILKIAIRQNSTSRARTPLSQSRI